MMILTMSHDHQYHIACRGSATNAKAILQVKIPYSPSHGLQISVKIARHKKGPCP